MSTEREVHVAGKVIHEHGVVHGWFGPRYKKTFEELRDTDPLGFSEFTDIIREALEAAQKMYLR